MARTSTLPKRLQPMLATLTDAPFDDKGWIFEDKYDGFRMVAKIEDGSVILYSRNGKIISHNYIEVAKALEGVKGDVLGRRFFVALHLPEVPSPWGGTALIWINDLLGPVGDQNFRAAYGAPAHLPEIPDIPDQRMCCFVHRMLEDTAHNADFSHCDGLIAKPTHVRAPRSRLTLRLRNLFNSRLLRALCIFWRN